MINENSINNIQKASFSSCFCRPFSQPYCFSKIPATIKSLLTGQILGSELPIDTVVPHQYDRVILFLIDGFGWRFLEKYLDHPFLQRFEKRGIISKITSQFPSTTVAHLTCLHTGLPVGQHGLYEWYHYEPLVDQIVMPLLFAVAGEKRRNTLAPYISPEKMYPFSTLYEKLFQIGIPSYLLYYKDYAFSPYSTRTGSGSKILSYQSAKHALDILCELLENQPKQRGYFYVYLPDIDTVSHKYGPDSFQTKDFILYHLNLLETIFNSQPILSDPKTAILITADHGQVAIDPTKVIYVNHLIPGIQEWIEKNKTGQMQLPAGSSRDFFLHIKPHYLAEAYHTLNVALKDIAEVYLTADLIQQQIFGISPSQRFLERIGNLVILPYSGQSVFWYEPGRFEGHFKGHHGGMTREEMESIFLFMN